MRRKWIEYLIGSVGAGLLSLHTPMHGQMAVAVVSDIPETMTNIRRYQQYVLQAQQFLEEAEYWVETGNQLYQVIDRLGSSGSFWRRLDSLLDGVQLAGKVSVDQEWGGEWYPDEYLRMVRESSRFGQALQDTEKVVGDRNLQTILERSRYVLGSTVAYADSMRRILQEIGRQSDRLEEQTRHILEEPVLEQEGVAGLMEKEQALQSVGIAAQGMTNSLLSTLLQTQVEQFSQTQLDRLIDWEYEQAVALDKVRRDYEQKNAALMWYRNRVDEEMKREQARYDRDKDILPVVTRFSIGE
jgi:hypothetical protein